MCKTIALFTDSLKMPNIALMKLSSYHKAVGDSVEWFVPIFAQYYDKIYYSKIFSFSRPDGEACLYGNVDRGGTGIDIHKKLPDEIDAMPCDYGLYPDCDYAIGFITRGCIRRCDGCVVPEKEGNIYGYQRAADIVRPNCKKIVLLDNNILASDFGLTEIAWLTRSQYHVDFNQGLDARLITKDIAKLLAQVKYIRYLRIACDTAAMIKPVANAVDMMRGGGYRKEIFCYTLVREFNEAYSRIMTLDRMGITPFAQPFIDYAAPKKNGSRLLNELARWTNRRHLFKSCTFEEYLTRRNITFLLDYEQTYQ